MLVIAVAMAWPKLMPRAMDRAAEARPHSIRGGNSLATHTFSSTVNHHTLPAAVQSGFDARVKPQQSTAVCPASPSNPQRNPGHQPGRTTANASQSNSIHRHTLASGSRSERTCALRGENWAFVVDLSHQLVAFSSSHIDEKNFFDF